MTRTCVLLAVMAALLAGCRSGCDQDGSPRPEGSSLDCFVPRNDGGTEDSLREYHERMERWEMLHGGMSRWESDK